MFPRVPLRRWSVLSIVALLAACSSGGSGGRSTPRLRSSSTSSQPNPPAAQSSADDWPTFHHDAARTGVSAGGSFGRPRQSWRSPSLDATVYASPLIVGNRVYVATEGDSVYALDAANGTIAWRAALGDPVPGADLPCGNINPSGITGTPVVDVTSHTLFAVAFLRADHHHELFALDLADGHVKFHRPIDPPGLDPRVEQQRGALTISGGRVYVAFGGLFGDCGPYKGAVVASALDGGGGLLSFEVPTTREAGIWAPPGPAVDGNGALFVSTGNSESTSAFDYGNAVIRLTPDLALADYFADRDWVQLNRGDVDIGSLGPALLSGGRVFVAGKAGTGYLLAAGQLGHVGGERFSARVCRGAYGGAAWSDPYVYVPCQDGLVALRVEGERFVAAWRAVGMSVGSPIVAGGAVWVIDIGGTMHALDATTGAERFSAPLGDVTRFATAAAKGNQVVVAAGNAAIAFTMQ
jgi:outer membrane protein assembly factor BamB